MSLRLRLALLFAGAAAVAVAVIGVIFLWQLRAAQVSALDSALRLRAGALAAQVRAGGPGHLPAPGGGQQGQHQGRFAAADEVSQLLSPQGRVLRSSADSRAVALVTGSRLRQAAGRPVTFTTMTSGERLRVLALPARAALPVRAARPVIVVTAASTDIADAAQARAQAVILVAGPIAVLAAGLGAWALAGGALRPVSRMRRRLSEITEHNPGARLAVPAGRDEIASLAVTMNSLLDRLQLAMDRQREFVADASHELLTPLTALRAELELASRPGRSRPALAEAVTAAAGDTDRLIRLAEDLLLLARFEEGGGVRAEPVDVPGLLSDAARAFAGKARARGVSLQVRADPALAAAGDPDRLRQAMDNLLSNAIRHSAAGGVAELTARAGHRDGQAQVIIEIRDHGPGFPAEFLPHAFERFRRADAARSRAEGGAGLGLAIVASIARAHHGRAVAGNHPQGGARVSIEIPARPPSGR